MVSQSEVGQPSLVLHRGLTVVTSPTGQAGIQALRRRDFDAAVLDLKMEDMDGIELLKIFRNMDPHLGVVMLTGHGSAKAREDGQRLGAFAYLNKPCEFADLRAAIQSAAEHTRRGRG